MLLRGFFILGFLPFCFSFCQRVFLSHDSAEAFLFFQVGQVSNWCAVGCLLFLPRECDEVCGLVDAC